MKPTATTAYLGVGSNIDPFENIPRALRMLRDAVTVTATSTFYRTPPLLRKNQPDYLNGVWQIHTTASAHNLKCTILAAIEKKLHRARWGDAYAPRIIDLDLLLYGDRVIHEGKLHIPDPNIYSRAFVAIPLVELAPNLIIPDTRTRLRAIVRTMETGTLHPEPALTKRLRRIQAGKR